MEKWRIVLSLVLSAITGKAILISCYYGKWCNLLQITYLVFIQRGFKVEDVPRRRLDGFSFGIVLAIISCCYSFDILDGQAGKYIGKDKKWPR